MKRTPPRFHLFFQKKWGRPLKKLVCNLLPFPSLHRPVTRIDDDVRDVSVLEVLSRHLTLLDAFDEMTHLFMVPVYSSLIYTRNNLSSLRFSLFHNVSSTLQSEDSYRSAPRHISEYNSS